MKNIDFGMLDKVKLICPTHGEFSIRADALISASQGCPKCYRDKVADKKDRDKTNRYN